MKTHLFERPEGSLAFDDSHGDGQLVIMLPGMGALRSEYRYLAPALIEAGYRVVTTDLRGHGESSANWSDYTIAAVGGDILALNDHLDASPAHVIGTSFAPGAMVYASAERPEAFRSLTLISSWLRDASPNFIQKLLTAVLLTGPWRVAGWIMFYKTLYPTSKPGDFTEYLEKLSANLHEPGRFAALKGLGFSPKTASAERIGRVRTPSLVVMGTKDPDWPDPAAEGSWIVDHLAGSSLLLVQDAGHYPQTEMPEKVIPGVLDFLGSNS